MTTIELIEQAVKLLRQSRDNYGADAYQTEAIDILDYEVLPQLKEDIEQDRMDRNLE